MADTIDITRLRKMVAAATPGPWFPFIVGKTIAVVTDMTQADRKHTVVNWPGFDFFPTSKATHKANASLIAGAPSAILSLCDEVDRLCSELEAVKADAAAASDRAQWRLLTAGELIQAGDEGLQDNCMTWLPMAGWEIGMSYSPAFLVPIRRRVAAIDAAMKDKA